MTVEELYDAWLDSDSKNGWLIDGTLSVYVRKSRRRLEGEQVQCIDIANISADPPGRGRFTKFLDHVLAKGDVVFIENLMEERFAKFFERRGFRLIEAAYETCAYYM